MSRLLLWTALVVAGCAPSRTVPNVLLITIDTLRADRLGSYGHENAHTPVLDRLAAEGVRFDQAASHVPMTLPSHASLLTGRSPVSHGVRTNGAFRLADEEETLAEILGRAGYRTGAILGAVVLNGRYGLRQGFEDYEDLVVRTSRGASELERDAARVTARALAWLERGDERPFFLWVHYFDPHMPYAPPPAFRDLTGDPYQGEVAYVDQEIGRLLRALSAQGLDGRTAVIVTSDHGEGLGEHGEPTHSYFVYETTLRVPLLLREPGIAPVGRVVTEPVRTVDVAPTILDLAGLPAKADADGVSLLPWIRNDPARPELPVYGESLAAAIGFGYSPLRSLRVGRWKLIWAPSPELYDLAEDPRETENRAASEPARVAALRAQLAALVREEAAAAPGGATALPVDATTRSQLQQLGYVGAGADAGSARAWDRDPEPRGPDPKEVADLFDRLAEGEGLHKEGRYAEAERAFRAVLERDPDNEYALTYLAILYGEQKQLDRALAVFDRLAGPPALGLTLEIQGKLLIRKQEWQRARAVFEALRAKEPHNVWAHFYLGRVARALGQIPEAVRSLEQAVRVEPSLAEAHAGLGEALLEQGDAERAREELRAAIALAPGRAAQHELLGRSLEQLGRPAEALEQYRRTLDLDPSRVGARERAALALVALDRLDEAQREIQPVLAVRPGSPAALAVSGARALADGDLEFAELLFGRAVSAEADLAEGWYQLSRVHRLQGHVEAAAQALDRAIATGGEPYRERARREGTAR